MAVYRFQVVSVGMWRGKIKRWNTTFHASQQGFAVNAKLAMDAVGWKLAGDVVGACSGGVASVATYNAAGGPPIDVTVYFDWQAPSTWIPYDGSAWSGIDPATPLDASGESAAVVMGRLPGLSSTGKPVFTRKYLHAIPSRTATNYTDPDIPAAVASGIASKFSSSLMGNAKGVTPSSVSCEQYYLNHQRVRGRRRTTRQVASQSFSAGVVAGAGAAQGAAPFPGN